MLARRTALQKIGRGVLRLRLYYGWSQRDLEHKSKVDQTTISRLERGVLGGLSIRRLAAILDALHVGDIVFDQPELIVPPTNLEIMLFGDRWTLARDEADRRLRWQSGRDTRTGRRRPGTRRATISTRSPSEINEPRSLPSRRGHREEIPPA